MKQLRDGLYGYIHVSHLEEVFIKRPEFLRLHRVLQNSTAFHTYPNNRGSRFSHSLGAMHVAGKLYCSLVHNDPEQEIENILFPTLKSFLKHIGRKEEVKKYLKTELDALYRRAGWHTEDWCHIVLFQAVRLAALVHDIGHLPYSHVTELAIKDAILQRRDEDSTLLNAVGELQNKFKKVLEDATDQWFLVDDKPIHALHEMIGIVLADEVFGSMLSGLEEGHLKEDKPNPKDFWKACWMVAVQILCADQLGHFRSDEFVTQVAIFQKGFQRLSSWYALGNLINGEIDCDRIDYLRRDPRNCGADEIASFDFERVTSSVKLVQPPAKRYPEIEKVEKYIYVPGFDRRALSALENLLYDRLRQYRWLVSHHNVVRTDLALQRLVCAVIHVLDDSEVDEILSEHVRAVNCNRLWESWHNLTVDFRYIDDSWLETIFQELYKRLVACCESGHRSRYFDEVCLYLDVFLNRETGLMKPLWKRIDGFVPFARGFAAFFAENFPDDMRANIPEAWPKEQRADLWKWLSKGKDVDLVRFSNEVLSLLRRLINSEGSYQIMHLIEQAVSNENEHYIFAMKIFSPYKGTPIVLSGGELCDLEELSSLVSNLRAIWRDGLRFYAYLVQDRNETKKRDHDIDLVELGRSVAREIATNRQLLKGQFSLAEESVEMRAE